MAVNPKIPPHNIDAEVSILGSILIDPDAIVRVADFLTPESFYDPSHQKVYEAMQVLYEKRMPIDAVTLTDQLKKMKVLSDVGGAAAIARISNTVSTSANVV